MAIGASGTMIIELVLSRALYVMHSILVIWKAVFHENNSAYWGCMAMFPFMLIDMVLVFIKGSYTHKLLRLICPSTLFYIISTLPPLIYLELDRLNRILSAHEQHTFAKNVTSSPNGTAFSVVVERLTFNELVYFHGDDGLEMLEQLLLIVIISARWVMPKGELTQNDLSQMLFVYSSIATDSMELFVLFKSESVAKSFRTSYVVLGAWILSLLQFTLLLHSSPRKSRGGEFRDDEDPDEEEFEKTPEEIEQKKENISREKFCLLASFFLMDAPYLIIRSHVLLVLKIINYNVIFYFCKNALLVIFTFYRFAVIYDMIPGYDEDDENLLFYNDYIDFTDFNEPGDLASDVGEPPLKPEPGQQMAEEEDATPSRRRSRRSMKSSTSLADRSEAVESKRSHHKSKHGLHGDASEAGDLSTVSRRKSRRKSRTNLDDDKSELSHKKSRRKSRTNLDDDKSELTQKKSRRKSRTNLGDDKSELSQKKSRRKSRTNLDDDKSELSQKKSRRKSTVGDDGEELSRRKSKKKSKMNLDDDGGNLGKKKSKAKSRTNLDDGDDISRRKSKRAKSKTVADDDGGWDPVKKKKSKAHKDD